jgi:hypothetical protein
MLLAISALGATTTVQRGIKRGIAYHRNETLPGVAILGEYWDDVK